MVKRRDLYYELITLQRKLANTLVDGKHKQDLISRIKEVSTKIEYENKNIFLDVKEADLIEFRQQIINKYPDLHNIFQLYWYAFSPFLDIDETLSYSGFEKFNSLLYFALVGNKNDNDAKAISALDYDYYIRIYSKIDKIAFFDILFKILVEWTDKDDILHYSCFMWTLLDIIADLKWNPPRLRPKREIKNILRTETDVTMFGRFFEGKQIRENSLKHCEYWKKVDGKAKLRVATRRVGANLDEAQIKAIADIYYSKTNITSDENIHSDSDSDEENDRDNIRNEKYRDNQDNNTDMDKSSPQQTKPESQKSREQEYYDRLKNVKGKVNSWNHRKFNSYTWDPDDKGMLGYIYEGRGCAVKMLKYFDDDDYIDEQMEKANVHAIDVLKKFDLDFKARASMYVKKHVVRGREIREKIILPTRTIAKPRFTPHMMRAKVLVKERGIGAFMQATKGAAAKESKKSWETLAKIMENRNKRRLKRETMMLKASIDKTIEPSQPAQSSEPSEPFDDTSEVQELEKIEELEELLHQQLLEEAEIEKTIKALSAEELLELELDAKVNGEEIKQLDGSNFAAIDFSNEEATPAIIDSYLNELKHHEVDDMTDNLSEGNSYTHSHDLFSPSNILNSNGAKKLKPLTQSAFLVLRSSPAPETNLKIKDELENRKNIRKGKDPLFPRSFISSSGEFLTAVNLPWKAKQHQEQIASKFEAKKLLNSAIKKSKDDNQAQTVHDIRLIKDDIEASKKKQAIKNEKRFDQIRSYKLFRRRMLAYLKETKNPNTTDCMRFMNEQMVNIILNRYDNIDPNELMSELFETVEQNGSFIPENSNNPRKLEAMSPELSSGTYMILNEDLQNLNAEQSEQGIDAHYTSENLEPSEFGSESFDHVAQNDETISTKELLAGKFSPLATVRSIHPDQDAYGNRKYWNAMSPGWYTLGSGFRSQSPSSPRSRSPSPTRSPKTIRTNYIDHPSDGAEITSIDVGDSQMSEGINLLRSYNDAINDNGDDLSIDDSIDGDTKDKITKLDSPSVEIPSVRIIYTPEVPPDSTKYVMISELSFSREGTPAVTRGPNSDIFEQQRMSLDAGSSDSVNTTNIIINQNKNLMRLHPITPPAMFSDPQSFSVGISPKLFDNSKSFERRIIRNSHQPSTILMRKSSKYNQLQLFPSRSLEHVNVDDDDFSINKDKVILKLNELKVKETGNALYSTKSKTIEGRYRSGTSITPKRELLNILAGRDKNLKPFCGM